MKRTVVVSGVVALSIWSFAVGSRAQEGGGIGPESFPAGLKEVVAAAVRESGYEAVWQVGTPIPGLAAAWQAPNRAHGFRTYFAPEGIRLMAADAMPTGSWRFSLDLAAFGRRGRTAPVGPARLDVRGNRAEYARGPVVEWYVNDSRGLEQGFTIAEKPAETSEPATPVVLESAITGDLKGTLTSRGRRVEFTDAAGASVFAYSGLRVFDATGRELPSHLDLGAGKLSITYDDANAAYPVTVDPIIASQQERLVASDVAHLDGFGNAVAIDGDTAVVGCQSNDDAGASSGSAYVFVRNGTGWTQEAKLVASDASAGDAFGISVGISGDTIAVAAGLDDTGAGIDAGSAYVFQRSGTNWTERARLFASDASAGDFFGRSIAIDGNTIVVGADGSQRPDSAGAAYVFIATVFSWSEQAKLVANDAQLNDAFGFAVAVDGDTVAVGAPYDDNGIGIDAGAAFIFKPSGGGWTQEAKLLAIGGSRGDVFGISVALSGDTAVIGCVCDDSFTGANSGSAHVFVRSAGTWSEQAMLIAGDPAAGDRFGCAVSVEGDVAVIGANLQEDPDRAPDSGAVYVFSRNGSVWTQEKKLKGSSNQTSNVGCSVAYSDGTVVAGACLESNFGFSHNGSAYVFSLTPVTCPEPRLLDSSLAVDDQFGWSVSVDGDTAVVGAPSHNSSGVDSGCAFVYVRNGENWAQEAKLEGDDSVSGDRFGTSVAVSGNTIVIGAEFDNSSAGSVYVFVRSGTSWSQFDRLAPSDGAAGDRFGQAVALSGDTLVVGASGDSTGSGISSGSAYVFVRDGAGWTQQAKLLAGDGSAQDRFGNSVALFGDTVVVGCELDGTPAGSNVGSADVFERSGGIWTQVAHLLASDGEADDNFGNSVGIHGDTIVVGSQYNMTEAGTAAGSAYVFVRNSGEWSEQAQLVAGDAMPSDRFGSSVSLSGDTLVVGAADDSTSVGARTGSAYVFRRSGSTWVESRHLVPCDGDVAGFFGDASAASGCRIVVGAYRSSGIGTAFSGAAYVFSPDTVAPQIVCPSSVVAASAGSGTVVDFTVTATDAFDESPVVECTPPSGSSFANGTTAVSCTATDCGGNVAMCSFDVIVLEDYLFARRGNVNGGAGPIGDVLFVNGQVGDPVERKVTIAETDPLEIRVERPPSKPSGIARYTMYLWLRTPDATTLQTLPFSIGTSCLPMPLNSAERPQPKKIANNLGHATRLGVENWPGPVTQPAPTVLLNLPTGVGKAVTFFVQGIISDSASPQGQLAVTNGVLVEVTE